MPRDLTFPSILATIGHTPLVSLERVIPADHARVLVKCELVNPMHTVKDRVVLALIEGAERDGSLVLCAAGATRTHGQISRTPGQARQRANRKNEPPAHQRIHSGSTK